MTRSFKRHNWCGNTTHDSEKQDKLHAHRRIRHAVRQSLHVDPSTEILPLDKEFLDPWLMDKDGKQMFDPEEFPELKRK